MIYSGKWQVKQQDNDTELHHVLEAVQRDAVRTDPTHPFYTTETISGAKVEIKEGDNIQKLVNIITIYTLEHDELSYTQGMTDLLSPILYVMQREADAYICFAAMVERIKGHFGLWCEGTLNKLERLRHLCEVLDPQLFHYLTNTIEEDAFALFFGMVLIECRREFSFEDSFHLFEAVWAGVACMKDKIPHSSELSHSEWARFMTYSSKDDLQQVFGETECAYTAEPLRHNTISDGYSIEYRPGYSRNASLISQSQSPTTNMFARGDDDERPRPHTAPQLPIHNKPSPSLSINPSEGSSSGTHPYVHIPAALYGVTEVTIEDNGELTVPQPETRPRSYTDPSSLVSSHSDGQITSGLSEQESASASNNIACSHSESELYDSFSQSNKVPARRRHKQIFKQPTEMSDMSSISSSNGNSQLLESVESRNAPSSSSRSRSPLSNVTPKNKTLTPENTGAEVANTETHQTERGSNSVSPEPDFKTPVQLETPTNMTEPIKSESSVYQTAASSSVSSRDMMMNGHIVTTGGEPVIKKTNNVPSSNLTVPTSSDSSVYQTAPSSSASSHEVMINGHIVTGEDEHLVRKKKPTTKSRVVQQGGRLTIEHFAESSLPFSVSPTDEQLHSTLTESSPGRRRRRKTVPIDSSRASPYDEDLVSGSSRVTPVAFFDTMEQLATSVPSSNANFGHLQEANHSDNYDQDEEHIPSHRQGRLSRANSEISLLISQLVSTEQAAPRVTREKSLAVPVSDCFPLFVCLAILVQNRHQIMRRTTDFVGLSVLLNAQAGRQDIDLTLQVAKRLYKTYRKYQLMYFGPEYLDYWLDMDGVVKERGENNGPQEIRSRTSQVSDNVFVNST